MGNFSEKFQSHNHAVGQEMIDKEATIAQKAKDTHLEGQK